MKICDKKRDFSVLNMKKESLTFEELAAILSMCDTLEDECLIKLAVTTGIRREDLVKVEVMNVDLDRGTIVFWEEKKDRPWMVALEPDMVKTLRQYLNMLPKGSKYLFGFTGRTAYNKFQDLCKRAGISKHLSFHALRRSFIRLSKQLGRDMRFVMDQTGDSARVIMEEYEGYTPDEMVQKLRDTDGITEQIKGVYGFNERVLVDGEYETT